MGAEYSFRWNPAQGGPASAEAVFHAIKLAAGAPRRFEVRYFSVDAPGGVPAGVGALLRERGDGRTSEWTYKLRGAAPWMSGLALDRWNCPLPEPQRRKDEVDVSFVGTRTVERAYSRSCSHESDAPAPAPPQALNPRPAGCASTTTRWHAGALKVELWRFGDGRELIEVSRIGADRPSDLADFRDRVVRPLVDLGAKAEPVGKSTLGAECR